MLFLASHLKIQGKGCDYLILGQVLLPNQSHAACRGQHKGYNETRNTTEVSMETIKLEQEKRLPEKMKTQFPKARWKSKHESCVDR